MKSPAPTGKTVKQMRKEILHSAVFMLAALFAVIMICLAWFVNSARVDAGSIEVSTAGERFFLATLADGSSVGTYDQLESVPIVNADGSISADITLAERILRFFRGENVMLIPDGSDPPTERRYIIGNTENISLMVNSGSSLNNHEGESARQLSPGASGKLTFYIIPLTDDLNTVTVTLNPTGYQVTENPSGQAEMSVADQVTGTLLTGHLLFFGNRDANGYYSDWLAPEIAEDGTVSVRLSLSSDEQGFEKNRPAEVTVYWVWPLDFRDILYTASSSGIAESPLFASISEDYTALLNSVNLYPERYGYDAGGFVPGDAHQVTAGGTGMLNETRSLWQYGYNNADQRIGTTVAFLHLRISAEEAARETTP